MKQNYKIKVLLIVILIFIFNFSSFIFVDAALFSFDYEQDEAYVGDIILVPVYIESGEENIFVVKASINFSKNLLWFKSFVLAPGWISVSGEKFNFIDNRRGLAAVSAGLEGGISGRTLLGVMEFIAVADGIAEISVFSSDGSAILNHENRNILDGGAGIDIIVSGSETADVIPPQLFDIGFSVESYAVRSADDLIARVSFESFGFAPTPVDMVFSIVGDDQRVLASFQDSIVVQTEAVFTKRFSSLSLPQGNYTLHLNTRYGPDILDDFQEKFSIERPRYFLFLSIAGVVILAGGAVLFLVIKRRGKR